MLGYSYTIADVFTGTGKNINSTIGFNDFDILKRTSNLIIFQSWKLYLTLLRINGRDICLDYAQRLSFGLFPKGSFNLIIYLFTLSDESSYILSTGESVSLSLEKN